MGGDSLRTVGRVLSGEGIPPSLWVVVLLLYLVTAGGGDSRAAPSTDGKKGPASIATGSTEDSPATQTDSAGESALVHWFEWDDAAFERAKRQDKLILLDLTAVWCHACHVMERTTYSDPEIIKTVNERFVPIRVDTDRRPDIEARYKHGGWPTTSVLLHTGEILFQANFLESEEMKIVLEETDSAYREDKVGIAARAAQVWTKVDEASSQKVPPEGPIDPSILEHSVSVMRVSFDARHGGFSDAPKFFQPDAITFAFLLYHRTQDDELRHMALKTLDEQLKLYDPVWGGFYRYAEGSDWSSPHYEKLLSIQALNLGNYLEAYQVTKIRTYRNVATGIMTYVNRFLASAVRGEFYSSQNPDVGDRDPERQAVAGAEYFPLPERRREEVGIPSVDRTVYTSANALIIENYLRAYQVLGDEQAHALALKALGRLYRERYSPGRGMARVVVDGRPEGFGLLNDQIAFASALVAAFLTTGHPAYLGKAEQLAVDLFRLEDPRLGGFFDRPPTGPEQGLLRHRYKPMKDNLRASMLLSDLFYLTNKPRYRDSAERTLRFVLNADEPLPIPLIGTAVDRFLRYPVHIVVVGTRTRPATRQLFAEALRLYAPGKIVRLLDPAEDALSIGPVSFPPSPVSQAYVCTDRFCSKPIRDPAKLRETLALVLSAGTGATPKT